MEQTFEEYQEEQNAEQDKLNNQFIKLFEDTKDWISIIEKKQKNLIIGVVILLVTAAIIGFAIGKTSK